MDTDTHSTMTASEVLDREFFEIRAKILEIAASFDRLDRSSGNVSGDARLHRLRQAIDILLQDSSDRAEQVQQLFSRDYDPAWRSALQIDKS